MSTDIRTITIRYDASIDPEGVRCFENDIATACETHEDLIMKDNG